MKLGLIHLRYNVMNSGYYSICLLLILFFSTKVISQEVTTKKNNNISIKEIIPDKRPTVPSLEIIPQEYIFVLFEENEYSKQIKTPRSSFNYGEYYFRLPNTTVYSELHGYEIILIDRKYKDFDAKFSDNPLPRFKVNKSFIRKNKKRIFTINKMRAIGYEKIFALFNKAKHIYLIDKSEIHDNLITIKEVQLYYIATE